MIVRCGDLFLEIDIAKIVASFMLDIMHVVVVIRSRIIMMMMTASIRGRRGQSKGNIFGRTIFWGPTRVMLMWTRASNLFGDGVGHGEVVRQRAFDLLVNEKCV